MRGQSSEAPLRDESHPTAIVQSNDVAEGCSIGEFAVVRQGVTLGASVVVAAGARLLGSADIRAGAQIGPNVVIGSDDRSGDTVTVGVDVRVEAGVSVLPGVELGRGSVIRAGSVVTHDVPAYSCVAGNPARIVGYATETEEPESLTHVGPVPSIQSTRVPGVKLVPVTNAQDLRGQLTATEFSGLPFAPARAFFVHGVPSTSVRGAHAHLACGQFLLCMNGSVTCVADNGHVREAFRLATNAAGLFIPPMIWSMQYRYSRDAILFVLAEHPYDPSDYVRDYEEFLGLISLTV